MGWCEQRTYMAAFLTVTAVGSWSISNRIEDSVAEFAAGVTAFHAAAVVNGWLLFDQSVLKWLWQELPRHEFLFSESLLECREGVVVDIGLIAGIWQCSFLTGSCCKATSCRCVAAGDVSCCSLAVMLV